MANLEIKDGAGATRYLRTTLSGSENIPHHVIEGVVTVTSSQTNAVYVTGGILLTDSEVRNYPNTALWVTSSFANPVYVSSSIGKELYVTNTSTTPMYVTSSEIAPLVVKQKSSTIVTRAKFSTYDPGQIDWGSSNPARISGTFIIADSSSVRTGILFANNTSENLYVAIGNGDYSSTNGFGLSSTASAPYSYSFIVYPSGTYSADSNFVNLKHSGFFVSSSAENFEATIVVTTVE